MNEDFINAGMNDEDAVFPDASVCTTNAEKHYTVNHVKEIKEVYLETQGKYDETMTTAVKDELLKKEDFNLI